MWRVLDLANKKMQEPIKFCQVVHSTKGHGTEFVVEHSAFPQLDEWKTRFDIHSFRLVQDGEYLKIADVRRSLGAMHEGEIRFDPHVEKISKLRSVFRQQVSRYEEFLAQHSLQEEFAKFTKEDAEIWL